MGSCEFTKCLQALAGTESQIGAWLLPYTYFYRNIHPVFMIRRRLNYANDAVMKFKFTGLFTK